MTQPQNYTHTHAGGTGLERHKGVEGECERVRLKYPYTEAKEKETRDPVVAHFMLLPVAHS